MNGSLTDLCRWLWPVERSVFAFSSVVLAFVFPSAVKTASGKSYAARAA